MKYLLLFSLLFVAPISWSHSNYQELIFYNQALNQEPDPCLYHVFNLFSNAIMRGLVVNGSHTGLGTKNPTGKQLQASGLYYQLMNIISIADQEITRQLYHEDIACLPERIQLQTGSFAQDFVASTTRHNNPSFAKIQQALALLFPNFVPFALHQLEQSQLTPTNNSIAAKQLARQVKTGIQYRLKQLTKLQNPDNEIDVSTKLQTLLYAYTPLSSNLELQLHPDGVLNLKLLLPALYLLQADNIEDINSWYLTKGLASTKFSQAIHINLAKLTHISYLEHADLSENQVIQINLNKHLQQANAMTMQIIFGKLNHADDDLTVDSTDPNNALHIQLYLDSPIQATDSISLQNIKHRINQLGHNFTIEARIHKLGLTLYRHAVGTTSANSLEAARLRPRYEQQSSHISFRIYKQTDDLIDYNSLKYSGFQCQTGSEKRWYCYREFQTWGDLLSFHLGIATELLINSHMTQIEAAIDQELSILLDQYLQQFADTFNLISDRLYQALFYP